MRVRYSFYLRISSSAKFQDNSDTFKNLLSQWGKSELIYQLHHIPADFTNQHYLNGASQVKSTRAGDYLCSQTMIITKDFFRFAVMPNLEHRSKTAMFIELYFQGQEHEQNLWLKLQTNNLCA